MEKIDDSLKLDNLIENRIIGKVGLNNSSIIFKGKNNIFVCEDNVKLTNSTISFEGDNSVVYLSSNKNTYYLSVSINNNSTCFFGKNNYINGTLHIIISEETNVIIGNDGLWSFGVWIRTADPHLIFDCETHKRINQSKSILVGDHVWVGQSVMLLKNTRISSGAIVSAMACVAGTEIASNTIFGGVPAKQIKAGVFWRGDCVHKWTGKETSANEYHAGDEYIYNYSQDEYIDFDELDKMLYACTGAEERKEILVRMLTAERKNRFVIK